MVVGNLVYIFGVVFALVASTRATEGVFEEDSDEDLMAAMFAKFRTAFPQIDTDGDGKIRCDQLMELFLAADPTLTRDNVDGEDMIAAMADADDDNMLTADELINFMVASAEEEPTRAQLGAAMFKLHDTDKNGKMSQEELDKMYLVQSGGVPEHGVTGMMEWALQLMDTDQDGQLSLEEYVNPQNGAISLDGF